MADVPFDLVDNRIFVDVRLNGTGPFHVIFDTGAGNVIRPEVARRLGLAVEDAGEGSGVGERRVRAGRTTVDELRLGGVRMTDQAFSVLSFDDVTHVFGTTEVDGIIGQPTLRRYVATIDYERRRLLLSDPSRFVYTGSGTEVPFDDSRGIPVVEGVLDGVAGRFAIDTGARSALVLFVPFVEKNGLRQKYRPTVEGINGWGIGGPVRAEVVRVRTLRLGTVETRDLVARLSVQRRGATTASDIAGLVGPDVLSQYRLVVDYPRKRLIFERNGQYGRRDTYDRAGMWLGQDGAAFPVIDVVVGGPAAEAGLAVGDRVLAIDGTSVEKLLLPEIRLRLRTDPPKTRVRLLVERDGVRRQATLVLRDLV